MIESERNYRSVFSIVVVFNNREKFQNILLESLSGQNVEYELVPIDNSTGNFTSAASALNEGGNRAKGKYIMFVHQDIELCSPTWLEDAEKMLDAISDLGIAGVAGISESGNTLKDRGRNVIRHTSELRVWDLANPIDKPEVVQTLDCCLLIIPHTVFEKLKFDDITCNDWHLYGEDYCLSCVKSGYKTYVIPLTVNHHSDDKFFSYSKLKILFSLGPLTPEFYNALGRVIRKHRKQFKYIYTCNGIWNTYQPVLWQRFVIVLESGFNLLLKKLKLKAE
jgi:hypothetical protein